MAGHREGCVRTMEKLYLSKTTLPRWLEVYDEPWLSPEDDQTVVPDLFIITWLYFSYSNVLNIYIDTWVRWRSSINRMLWQSCETMKNQGELFYDDACPMSTTQCILFHRVWGKKGDRRRYMCVGDPWHYVVLWIAVHWAYTCAASGLLHGFGAQHSFTSFRRGSGTISAGTEGFSPLIIIARTLCFDGQFANGSFPV